MSPLRKLLTLLHPSSVMSWLFVHRAPGWEETNVASVLGCLQGTGQGRKRQWDKMGQNGSSLRKGRKKRDRMEILM